MEKTYTTEIHCRNCGLERNMTIPLGMTVRDFARTKKCDKCGCHIDGSDQVRKHTKHDCKK